MQQQEDSVPAWRKPWISRLEQQNLLGEQLYPLLCQAWKRDKTPNLPVNVLPGRMTGMIVTDLPLEDVEELLTNPEALEKKYAELRDLLIASSSSQKRISFATIGSLKYASQQTK
jgi:hypothetical protein